MTVSRTIVTQRQNRARLSLQALEARDVPAATVLDLTTAGATATANGAILQQSGTVSTTDFHTFLRLNHSGTEEGYNTDARPFQLDQRGDLTVTHSLLLTDVPKVTIGTTEYRQFVLDVNEGARRQRITLDELRIYLAETGNLTGYNSRTKTLAGSTAVFDLDGAGNVSVKLNAALNNGALGVGDAVVLIPSSLFGNSTYLYLYSKLGGRVDANGGAESWGVLPVSTVGTASISGVVYAEINGVLGFDDVNFPPDQPVSGVTVQLERFNGTGWDLIGTQSSGFYSFTGLSAGTYRLTKLNDFPPTDAYDGLNFVGSAGGHDTNPFTQIDTGWSPIDLIDQIVITDGLVATGYNFELIPISGGG